MPTSVPDIVHGLPLFAGLNEQETGELIQEGRTRLCPKGRSLFVCGDEIRHFYILCEGAVQVFRETPEGREMTADILMVGDTLGELDLLQSQPTRSFNAVAINDVVVLEFSAAWFQKTVTYNSVLALNLLAMIARRADTVAIEAEHKSTMAAAQQVACFLERYCILHHCDPHGFDLPYSKTLIASRLGMELETFSRALVKVREHGMAVEGTKVSFVDIEEIGKYVCSSCSICESCKEYEALKAVLPKKDPVQATDTSADLT